MFEYGKRDFHYERLLKGIEGCNLSLVQVGITAPKTAINTTEISIKVAKLIKEKNCNNKAKNDIINALINAGIKLENVDTPLSLAILHEDKHLISVYLSEIKSPEAEGLSLLYAIKKHNCDIIIKLISAGTKLTEDMSQSIEDPGIKSLYKDLYTVQNLSVYLSVNSNEKVQSDISFLYKDVLIAHNICGDTSPWDQAATNHCDCLH